MRLLALIGIERGVFDDAELLLEAALILAPDYQAARFDYARALLERHKHPQARAELERLLALEPGNRQYKTLYATACVGTGEHEKAVTLYRELLTDSPRDAEIACSDESLDLRWWPLDALPDDCDFGLTQLAAAARSRQTSVE